MKKIFTIFSIAAAMTTVSAQANLFPGSDFNNWDTFLSSVDSHGLKYATPGVGTGVNGTDCLVLGDNTSTSNAYVFTIEQDKLSTNGITAISVKVKGNSGGVSFNVGSNFFNVPAGTTSDVTLTAEGQNSYTGTISSSDWITITLDLTGIEVGPFSMKVQKSSTNNLLVDDIKAVGVLGAIDITKANTLVRNTSVSDAIVFGKTADVKIYNVNGQLVKTASVKEGASLNVSDLAKGIYIVNGAGASQKIIKK